MLMITLLQSCTNALAAYTTNGKPDFIVTPYRKTDVEIIGNCLNAKQVEKLSAIFLAFNKLYIITTIYGTPPMIKLSTIDEP